MELGLGRVSMPGGAGIRVFRIFWIICGGILRVRLHASSRTRARENRRQARAVVPDLPTPYSDVLTLKGGIRLDIVTS